MLFQREEVNAKNCKINKKIHLDTIVIVDDYKNYYIYDDAYIISYLINLSMKKTKNNIYLKICLLKIEEELSKLRLSVNNKIRNIRIMKI